MFVDTNISLEVCYFLGVSKGKLDWSVCNCLTQLYIGRDMYRIYYIKNYMFRHFSLAIFRFRKHVINSIHISTIIQLC